jgi:aspartyl-tRNA(Asn)/glutamyl-tRNA(Gln) amidotransferase subunit A
VYREAALAAACASDDLRAHGVVPSLLAGVPISIKDLFDVRGDVTLAASKALVGRPAASEDAPIIKRLRAAGAILVGRTNLSEFAFSPLGVNPHYGTPGNPADRARVPGGSSSGAAVSAADGMAVAGIGSDTAGSCRIPAAFCGTVGFKPTQKRVPLEGTWPLSTTLDSVGPLAMSVSCCAIVDAALSGEPIAAPQPLPLAGLRLAVPQTVVCDDMDETAARAFQHAVVKLSTGGARILEIPFGELKDIAPLIAKPFFTQIEAYAWHKDLLSEKGDVYDQRIRSRILVGANASAVDYIALMKLRRDMIARAAEITAPFDAVLMPTIQHVAPTIAAVAEEKTYWSYVRATIRNPMFANFFNRCAISIPCHERGELPIGITLLGEHGGDRRLFQIALAAEQALQRM